MMRVIFIGTIVVAATTVGSLRGQDSVDVLQRLLKEAPEGWAILEKANRNIEIVGVFEEANNSRQVRKSSLRIVQCEIGSLAKEEPMIEADVTGGKGVFVKNSEYGFWLQHDKSANGWRLHLLKTGEPSQKWIDSEIRNRYSFATTPLSHMDPDKSFRDSLQDTNVQWKRAEYVLMEGVQMVKAYYSQTKQFKSLREPVSYDGYFIFDPSNLWACREWFSLTLMPKLQKGIPRRVLAQMSLGERPVNGVRPLRERHSYIRWDENEDMKRADSYHLAFVVASVQKPSIQPSEFLLAGYGLGEPANVDKPKRNAVAIWSTVAALITSCVLVGLIFSKWRRRAHRVGVS